MSNQPKDDFDKYYREPFKDALRDYIERRENKEYSYSNCGPLIVPKENNTSHSSVKDIEIIGISESGNGGICLTIYIIFTNSVSLSRFNDVLRTNENKHSVDYYRRMIDSIDMYWRSTKDYWKLKRDNLEEIKRKQIEKSKIEQKGLIIIIKENNKTIILLDDNNSIPIYNTNNDKELIENIKEKYSITLHNEYLTNNIIYKNKNTTKYVQYYIIYLESLNSNYIENKTICDISELDSKCGDLDDDKKKELNSEVKLVLNTRPLRILDNYDLSE